MGLTPRSPLTWIKPRFTLGQYLRNATEHVLLGTRGKAPVQFRSQPTWMFAPLQDHSHKPEEQYAVIERVSPGPYLELFARRPHPGWDAWGNQIASDIDIPGYPVPDSPVNEGPLMKGGDHRGRRSHRLGHEALARVTDDPRRDGRALAERETTARDLVAAAHHRRHRRRRGPPRWRQSRSW